jgi:hypothetical protein
VNFALLLLCASLALFSNSVLAFAQPTPAPSASGTPTNQPFPPWNREGETFAGYEVFRDELSHQMGKSKVRLAVVTPLLTDGDIATSLFAAQMRGVQGLALLDGKESKVYNSRHDYLARAKVPTWVVPFAKLDASLDFVTLIVLDNSAWRVQARLDETHKGSVFVSLAPYSPEEIFQWRTLPKSRFVQRLEGFVTSARGAKDSSEGRASSAKGSANLSESKANKSGGRLPRRLPRETRLQGIGKGLAPAEAMQESLGSMRVPAPPPNETDVAE